ncbi:MAG: Wzz/FepE/Etk N-terminal domain-containing protein [Candidatus Omnitrophica bacterium]|nr:Wzz/FepE/Etk N-terminal domain-containing protein [Candidatus Omnitrophota bacterium]
MDQNSHNYEEVEIDLSQYFKVIIKRKKTFIAVFLLILAIGFTNIIFSPKIYRSIMLIQPPVVGPALTGANDLESAENLQGMLINNVFNDALNKKLNLDRGTINRFNVIILNKTNILQVSVDLESKKKDFGVVMLQNLGDLISDSYAQRVESERADIVSQIKFNERAIVNANKRAEDLQEQIKEVVVREDKLREELKFVNINTAQILEKREGLSKGNTSAESTATLLLVNYLQSNSSYLYQVNNQLGELYLRRVNLEYEIKTITSQVNYFQREIDKLHIREDLILNLRIISQPRVLSKPLSPDNMTILAISIAMGFFLGMCAIFLQEFWVNNLEKKQ